MPVERAPATKEVGEGSVLGSGSGSLGGVRGGVSGGPVMPREAQVAEGIRGPVMLG